MATVGKNMGGTTDDVGASKNIGGNVQGGQIGSPISNEAYNVITALQAKLEGLEAYRKYAKDQSGGIWQELSQSDVQCVDRLVDELERLVKDGRFRMKQPGSSH